MLYPAVLGATLALVADDLGITASGEEKVRFGGSVERWPAFADSVEALARLKERYALVILSNIDSTSFAASNARLEVEFDLIVTAEEVGSYKPDPRNFDALRVALSKIDIDESGLLHVAQSLYHDHEPAKRAGLPTVWIDRRHDQAGFGATPPPGDAGVKPDWTFPSMAAFAEAATKPA
jgi:2-haloalkanoic acid dehalogenase type II